MNFKNMLLFIFLGLFASKAISQKDSLNLPITEIEVIENLSPNGVLELVNQKPKLAKKFNANRTDFDHYMSFYVRGELELGEKKSFYRIDSIKKAVRGFSLIFNRKRHYQMYLSGKYETIDSSGKVTRVLIKINRDHVKNRKTLKVYEKYISGFHGYNFLEIFYDISQQNPAEFGGTKTGKAVTSNEEDEGEVPIIDRSPLKAKKRKDQ